MNFKSTPIAPPTRREKIALRAMILIGYFSVAFFLYTLSDSEQIGNKPLYILMMITMVYLCLKYLHEWYHYFNLSVTPRPTATRQYTIDVLTTYCAGEPFDMLEQTLTAMVNMTYPHTTWCCDEADDPDVKALCQRLGVKHVTRTVKVNAKAGNINNALKQATGELCVVMDPDHIPAPDFLDQVVGYFEDPKVGYVQIVQAYYNQRESLVAKGAAQQTYQFYGPMMMCMNSYGTAQAIGANCTFRRAALDSIGGHAAGLSEDMHTAMQIHAKGWKSIYLPSILTRGLVPATLSSYYKQQLKWSRGTWELLLTTYPRLFTKFTWRQKLHYFLLPFHYLCGIIFFINFLIPVISLLTGYIPLRMDIIHFMLAAFPMLGMAIVIRHYVQKWVAEESERGFHIVGGILQIGAWWVHSIGFIYTLLRKKVPYIPTPKNDNDPLPFVLNLPNVFIAVVSLGAIIYGFTSNYNPYTIFMAVLASMQVLFMLFIFSISGYSRNDGKLYNVAQKIRSKTGLIIFTHGFLRRYSVALAVLLVTVFIFGYRQMQLLPTFVPNPMPGLQVFYQGAHDPAAARQLSVSGYFSGHEKPSIVPIYLPTGTPLPVDSIALLHRHNALPLLSWHPFISEKNMSGDSLLKGISAGQFDSLFLPLARQLAQHNKPVFLEFATVHAANYQPDHQQPELYKSAWLYVHQLFEQQGAVKVVWVWKPWNPQTADLYFPGSRYVDWLGVDVLDTETLTNATDRQGFYRIYQPFHRQKLFHYGIPVMITAAGTRADDKETWWKSAAANIDTTFHEIHSILVARDPHGLLNGSSWNPGNKQVLAALPASDFENDIREAALPDPATLAKASNRRLPDTLRGVVYDKGFYWFRNRHTMTKNRLEVDILAMKAAGINTVERSMPGFYDEVLDELLRKHHILQIGRFVSIFGTETLDDAGKLKAEKDKILEVVRKHKDKKNIIAWNLGNDVLFNLENETFNPGNFYYRNKYVTWLNELCKQIRAIDPERPLITDLNWDVHGPHRLAFYQQQVPAIDQYMLVASSKNKPGLKWPLPAKASWGKVPVELWDSLPAVRKSAFIPAWQDLENTDFISLNGLLDLEGRHKQYYRKVLSTWTNQSVAASPVPDIKILRPSVFTKTGLPVQYNIMYREDTSQWKLYRNQQPDLLFEWYLIRVDRYGNTMFIKKAGEGSSITLPIPEEPMFYRLMVEAVKGNDVKMAGTTLNTPLD